MMSEREKELAAREAAPAEKERALEKRERALDPFSTAVKLKKEQYYSKIRLTVRQMNVIIAITAALLALVVLLIVLEAAGIFKL